MRKLLAAHFPNWSWNHDLNVHLLKCPPYKTLVYLHHWPHYQTSWVMKNITKLALVNKWNMWPKKELTFGLGCRVHWKCNLLLLWHTNTSLALFKTRFTHSYHGRWLGLCNVVHYYHIFPTLRIKMSRRASFLSISPGCALVSFICVVITI